MYSRSYGNVIWTNHALERLADRKLPQDMAWQAFRKPHDSTLGHKRGTIEYKRSFGKYKVTVIAKQNEEKEWIILSCWIDPPFTGSIDIKKRKDYLAYKKASFWGKFLYHIKKQVGL